MVLVRVWRRRLLGGMGAAAIVPTTLLASLAVLAVAGGFGGLTALGQAFSGPPAPTGAITPGRGPRSARPLSPAILAALAVTPARNGQPGSAPPSSTGGGTRSGAQGTAPNTPPGGPGNGGGGGGGGQRRPSGRPASAPTPTPAPQPTLVDKLVGLGTSATAQVPAPAGPAATNALKSAGSTLDSIAPIKGP